MKKRINTQMYNTETAKKISEYFLHGDGGPASSWG